MRKSAAAFLALTLVSAASLAQAQPVGPPPVIPFPKGGGQQGAVPGVPGPPRPNPAQVRLERETRCLLIMSVVANKPEQRDAGMMGVYFFSGRILQINPAFDFAAGLRAVAPQLNKDTFPAEFKRCGSLVQTAARGLQAAQQAFNPKAAPPAVSKP